MENTYLSLATRVIGEAAYRCPVCGSPRYITDHGNHVITIHCSSAEARFWDCPRGSLAETMAKQHWDRSRQDMFLTMGDILKFVAAQ